MRSKKTVEVEPQGSPSVFGSECCIAQAWEAQKRNYEARGKHLKLTRPEPTEATVLQAILSYLARMRSAGRVIWYQRMNSGAGKLQYRNGQSQFMRFGFPGCPDILGQMPDGRLLAIEVKRPSGRLSADQDAFMTRAQENGALAFVARSVDDVVARFA